MPAPAGEPDPSRRCRQDARPSPGAAKGLGAALLRAAEAEARRLGRTLLTLDTEAGSDGERLYSRMGWIRFGQVPNYAICADGTRREAATFFYRTLQAPAE